MSVKGRIFAALGLIVLVYGLSSAFIAFKLHEQGPGLKRTEDQSATVASDAVPLLLVIKAIKVDVIQVQGWLTDIAATRARPGFDDGFTEAAGFAKKFAEDIAIARKHAKLLGLKKVEAAIDEMGASFPSFYEGGKKMAQAYIDHGPDGGNPMMEEFDGVASKMSEATDKLVSLVEAATSDRLLELREGAGKARNTNETLVSMIYVLAGGGILFMLAGSIFLVTTVKKGFDSLLGDVALVMEKDMETPLSISPERADEFGEVGRALAVFRENIAETEALQARVADEKKHAEDEKHRLMNKMADDFQSSVGGVVEGVSSSATELESSAQAMSATAEETSRQSGAVAAASEEASANVQTVASASEELSASIQEISRQVTQSTQIASNAVHEAERANEMVQGLASAANKIGEVVELITDIAEQTNLLALNATIEAARAGEAGKGFAVVASEVKNLANQTAKATEEIGAQISGIQTATQDSVEAIQGITATISQINEISSAIAAAVEEQGAATQEIARNVEQASAGTTEVSSNIQGVSQAASETGQAAGQITEAAGELSQQAEMLRAEVDKFIAQVRRG